MGPLRELDLADERRLDPDDLVPADLRHLRDVGEWSGLALEGPKQRHELVDLVIGEAGAAVADVVELAGAVDPQDERPEPAGPLPPTLGVAGDDELLLLVRLHLEPVPRSPARKVAGVRLLGDDALEALLPRGGVQCLAVLEGVRQPHGVRAGRKESGQTLVPRGEREVEERRPLHLEHVEDVVDERAGALLHDREARAALVVERADLPVEDAVGRPNAPLERPRDRREALREVVAAPAREARLPAGQSRDRPVAVPLDLEQPAVAAGNVVGERRQHRLVLAALPLRGRLVVLLAQDEPVLLVPVEMRRDERPGSAEPLALEQHREATVGLLLEKLVRPPVPDLHRPRAVLARRDLALEARVVERVVLDVHGEPAVTRVEGDALGDGPARQGAVTLETEVVVEPPCVVALDDEEGPLTPLRAGAEGLGSLALPPFSLVFAEPAHA